LIGKSTYSLSSFEPDPSLVEESTAGRGREGGTEEREGFLRRRERREMARSRANERVYRI